MDSEIKFDPEAQERKVWDAEKAARLLFLSFKFSQGSENLQHSIFFYLSFKHPGMELPDDATAIISKTKEMAMKYIRHSKHTEVRGDVTIEKADDTVEKAIQKQLRSWRTAYAQLKIEENKDAAASRNLHSICDLTISRDLKFLFKKGGAEADPPADISRNNSFFIDYVVNQKSTGVPELDQMFTDAHEYYEHNKTQFDNQLSLQNIRKKLAI